MPSKFLGVSRATKRTILNIDKSNHRRNDKSLSKAKLTLIRARVRHQIDLMDTSSKGSVKMSRHLCRYFLLVTDVFNRFLWLRPLESKALKLLCDCMNIKLIYSRPRHNQLQGKVERYYRALRSKMEYNLQKIGQYGVKWEKQLPLYQRILNNDPKEVIAYKTPFEIYVARNCNAFRESTLQDEILPSAGRARPTKNDRYRRSRQALKLRNRAKKATRRCDKRMQRTQLCLNPPSVYSCGEKVCIRLRGKPSNKRHVTEGRIEKRKIKLHTYEVSYTSPFPGKEERKWVSVKDITSLTLEREKQKKKYAKLTKKKKKLTIKKSITCL